MESSLHPERQQQQEDRLLTVGDLLAFVGRRKRIILITIGVFTLLAVIYCIFATRRYQSEALLEVRQPEDSLGLNSLGQTSPQVTTTANPLEETVTLETKVNELKSDALDLDVIEDLGLEHNPDFKRSFDPIGLVSGLFTASSKPDTPGTKFRDSPSRRARALRVFHSHLSADVVPGTRLISIKYSNPDPSVAAKVVTELGTHLAQYGFEMKANTTAQLSDWLRNELDKVREKAELSQQAEAKLRQETESYSIGTNSVGQESIYNPVIDQLQQSTAALNQAESNRILRAAVEQVVKTNNPQLISGLAGSGMLGSGDPQATNSLDLINNLEGQIAQLEATVRKDQVIYGGHYPVLVQERKQLQALYHARDQEIDRLRQRAKNDAMIAAAQAQRTRAEHDELLRRANILNDRYLRYQIAHQEAQNARQLYADLDQRLRQVNVTVGLQSADSNLFAPGLPADKPRSPRVLLILLAAIVTGGCLGVLVALIIDFRDDKVSSVQQLESDLSLPVLGLTTDYTAEDPEAGFSSVNYLGGERPATAAIEVLAHPISRYSEAMRSLRASVLLTQPSGGSQVLLVTGSMPNAGTSVTALNLGATYARTGARTLLVDANLRDPTLEKLLGTSLSPNGLSAILNGQLPTEWAVSVSGVPNLFFIPAGQPSFHSYDIVGSNTMKALLARWRKSYDVVIVDGPPLLPFADSALLAEQCDLIILVARYGLTTLPSLRRARLLLPGHLRVHTGVLLNAVPPRSRAISDYYGDSGWSTLQPGPAGETL